MVVAATAAKVEVEVVVKAVVAVVAARGEVAVPVARDPE